MAIKLLSDFSEFLYAISIEILGAFLVAVLTIALVFLRDRFFIKHVHNVTRLKVHGKKDNLNISCFYANSGIQDGDENVGLGYPFEYMSFATTKAYLHTLNKLFLAESQPSPATIEDLKDLKLNDNIILFGGPNHNLITGYIFGLREQYHNVPFYYGSYNGEDATLFYADDLKKPFVPHLNKETNVYVKDYGLILNVENPYNPEKRIIALIGCRSVGVLGATIFFTEFNKELKKATKKMKNFAAIIEVRGDANNVVGDPTLVKAVGINSIDETKIVDDYLKDIDIVIQQRK